MTVAVPFAAVARLIAVVLAALALCVPAHAAAPAVQARAYVVQSTVDGHTLAAREATTPRAMASITKLMTALVALQHVSLDDIVTVPAVAASVGESSMELRAGQRVPRARPPDRDARAERQRRGHGARGRRGGLGAPVRRAHEPRGARARARRDTTIATRMGSTSRATSRRARDIAELLREALRNPVIRRYAGTQRARLSDGRVVESTDNLLGSVGGIVGGKTGHTALAGWSQAAFARAGGVGITAVVLGSPSEAQRDADLAALLRFGLASYRMSKVVDPIRTYATSPAGWGRPPVRAVAPRAIVRPASAHRPLVERVVVPAVVRLPVAAGQRLGTLVVTDGSRVVARSPLVAAGSRGEPGAPAEGLVGCPADGPSSRGGSAVIVTVTLNAALDRSLTVPTLQLGQRHRASEVLDARGRKGDQRRTGAQAPRGSRRRDGPRRRADRNAHRRRADRRGDPERLRSHPRRVAHLHARRRPDVGEADGDQRVGARRSRRPSSRSCWTSCGTSRAAPTPSCSPDRCRAESAIASTPTPPGSSHGGACGSRSTRRASRCASALDAEPWLVAPNQHEAEQLVGQELNDEEDFLMALDTIAELGARNVLITLESGCFALVREDRQVHRYRAVVPHLEPVSVVGAGDALLAQWLTSVLDGVPAADALRLAVATGTASVLDVGAGRFDPAEAKRLAAGVEVHELQAVS